MPIFFKHRDDPAAAALEPVSGCARWGLVLGGGLLSLVLVACGGASGSPPQASTTVQPQVTALSSVGTAMGEGVVLQPEGLSMLAMAQPMAWEAMALPTAADPGVLMLLLPDAQDMADPRIAAWLDAASEVGVRVQPVSDSQFLALGSAALGYAGLILPDGLHVQASDAVVAAVSDYTQQGGRTLLVFDFGALTLLNGTPVYPVPKSRLSALAGVDYVLYDALRERTTGLGPVTGCAAPCVLCRCRRANLCRSPAWLRAAPCWRSVPAPAQRPRPRTRPLWAVLCSVPRRSRTSRPCTCRSAQAMPGG